MNFILPGILVFGLVVLIHELGHFLVAKACGVPIDRFSIGFGPKLFGFQRGRTEYVVSALPLGGYVKMAGEEPDSGPASEAGADKEAAATDDYPDPDTFLGHPWWHRVLIAIAGPAANFVLAVVITILMFLTGIHSVDGVNVLGNIKPGTAAERVGFHDRDTIVQVDGKETKTRRDVILALQGGESGTRFDHPTDVAVTVERDGNRVPVAIPAAELRPVAESMTFYQPAVVGEIINGMPAYVAGIQEGDRIVAIDGSPVRDWSDLITLIANRAGQRLTLTLERAGKTLDISITPMKQKENGKTVGRIGIWPEHREYVQRFPLGQAVVNGTMETIARVGLTAGGIVSMFANLGSFGQSVSGPIAIVEMSGEAAKRGLYYLLNFTSLISIALMVFNLLPIPILDGGMVVMSVAEGIRRRPVPIRVQALFQRVGFVLLGSMIVFVLLNDPLKMIRRNRAISESRSQTSGEGERVAPNDSAR